jgi:hypothetical protein
MLTHKISYTPFVVTLGYREAQDCVNEQNI